MDEVINIIITSNTTDLLDRIGTALLESRLISCIQVIGPIKSTYRWKGTIETAEEWLGIMKTRRGLYGRVQDEVQKLHPYETPQIEAFSPLDILPAYRRWLIEETECLSSTQKST